VVVVVGSPEINFLGHITALAKSDLTSLVFSFFRVFSFFLLFCFTFSFLKSDQIRPYLARELGHTRPREKIYLHL